MPTPKNRDYEQARIDYANNRHGQTLWQHTLKYARQNPVPACSYILLLGCIVMLPITATVIPAEAKVKSFYSLFFVALASSGVMIGYNPCKRKIKKCRNPRQGEEQEDSNPVPTPEVTLAFTPDAEATVGPLETSASENTPLNENCIAEQVVLTISGQPTPISPRAKPSPKK